MLRRLYHLFFMNARLCLLEVYSNKLRSVISSFGIFLGVASLLTLLSFLRAMEKSVTENVVKMGGLDILEIVQLEAETPEEVLAYRRSPGLLLSQVEELWNEIPEISMVLPELDHGHLAITRAGKRGHGHPMAVSLPFFDVFNYELASGRKFTSTDFSHGSRVCLLGNRIIERLFQEGEDPLGKKIVFLGNAFEVIGTIHTQDRWDRRARSVLYPFDTYVKYFGGQSSRLNSVKIKIISMEKLQQVRREITNRLTEMHRGVADFDILLNEEKIQEMKSTGRALNILLTVVAVLSLLTGGISIMNIMFAVIGDRIREIGLRKALGARRSDLFMQFVVESILLCFVGALPGMLAGSLAAWLPPELFPMEPFLLWRDYAAALGFTLGVGFAAGLFPALRAANMRPIEALQYV